MAFGELTPIARLALFATSAAVHVGVVLGVGGHAKSSMPGAGLELVEIAAPSIDTMAPEPPKVAEPAPAEERHAHAHAHSHTHPYPVAPDHDATPHDPSIVHAPFAPAAAPAMEAPAVAAAPEAAPVRFTMTMGSAVTASGAATHAPAHDDDHDHDHDGAGPETVTERGVDARPTLLHGDSPKYPRAATSAGVEADVPVAILIDVDGTVLDARAASHAGYGLDEEAVRAVRTYRFSRGLRAGKPVRVRMTWTVTFRFD